MPGRKDARTPEKPSQVPPQTPCFQTITVGGFNRPAALYVGVEVEWHLIAVITESPKHHMPIAVLVEAMGKLAFRNLVELMFLAWLGDVLDIL